MLKLDDFMGKLTFDGEKVRIFSIDADNFIFKGTKSDYFNLIDRIEYRVCSFYVENNTIIIEVKEN